VRLVDGTTDGRKCQAIADPVLRWTNPVQGRQAHGDVFLWTDRGRPTALLSLYEFRNDQLREHHEWVSLSLGGLTMTGLYDWAPKEPGIELKNVPDAPAPAKTAARRLRQMRQLSGNFTAKKTDREDQTRDLRLLSQPIYRYESTDPEVIDGALFGFVEVTDPEIVLLLEARRQKDSAVWQFAAARVNSIRVSLSYEEKPIWQLDTLPWSEVLGRKDTTYTIFRVK
jgi:hypothetical protein